ncbi:MAG: hypothetical protein ABIJ96_12550 [Elusimicrobiota bacterium]
MTENDSHPKSYWDQQILELKIRRRQEEVLRVLRSQPPEGLPKTHLTSIVGGNRERANQAIQRLIEAGIVRQVLDPWRVVGDQRRPTKMIRLAQHPGGSAREPQPDWSRIFKSKAANEESPCRPPEEPEARP